MHRLAVIDILNNSRIASLAFCLPVMLALGPEKTILYCSGKFVADYPEQMGKLHQAGIETVIDDYPRALRHKYFMADSTTRGNQRPLAEHNGAAYFAFRDTLNMILQLPVKHLVTYNHGTGKALSEGMLEARDFILYFDEQTMFESVGEGIYYCDDTGYPIVGTPPFGVEGTVAGVFHLEGQEEYGHLDKRSLRKILSEKSGFEFDPSLPLISFFHSHCMEGCDVVEAVTRLSEKANIIIKYHPAEYEYSQIRVTPFTAFSWPILDLKKPTVFHVHESSDNVLIKYTSDFCMVALGGGTFSSNILSGIRSFSVYTKRIITYESWGVPLDVTPSLRRGKKTRNLSMQLTDHIRALDILDTETILSRLNGDSYWREYDRQLPMIRRQVFGRYRVGAAAAEAAAKQIGNLLEYGTFRTPQLTKKIRGPVSRPVDFTGTL